MKQQTLAMAADQGAGFEQYRRRTKREDFLDAMNAIMPWAALCAVIEPHYPKAGNGRRPIGLERMLRIHLLQHWFNLADNAVEEALYFRLSTFNSAAGHRRRRTPGVSSRDALSTFIGKLDTSMSSISR